MISVIVPIYNVENYLCRSLNSIINQSFYDIEVILVDDGSTDGSGQICDDYCEKDNRIRVIHTENNGLPKARNVGLLYAKGDYLLMVDGDDVLHPHMIDTLWSLINNGDYDFSMCYGKRVWDVEALDKEIASTPLTPTSFELTRNSCMWNLFMGGNNVEIQFHVAWNKLYKRELLDNLLFSDTADEDTEFNNRVFQRINKAIYTNVVYYYWIQRSDSITHIGINNRYANVIYSYLLTLNNIPEDNKCYRSYCLRRMYRVMALLRYRTRGYESHELAVNHCKTLLKATSIEFLKNQFIPFFEKCRLFLFNYIPFLFIIYMNLHRLRYSISS